jgi:hypothetical protein
MSTLKVNGLPLAIAKELLLLRADIERTELLQIMTSTPFPEHQRKTGSALQSLFKLLSILVISLKVIRILRPSNKQKRKYLNLLPIFLD